MSYSLPATWFSSHHTHAQSSFLVGKRDRRGVACPALTQTTTPTASSRQHVVNVTQLVLALLAGLVFVPAAEAQRVRVTPDAVAQPGIIIDKALIADVQGEAEQRPVRPMREISLQDLVQAKIDLSSDTPKIIMMLEAFRTEKGMTKVRRPELRKRTRQVDDGQGNLVDQEYTVTVMVTKEIETEVKMPAGRKPKECVLSDFQFYDLAGKPVTAEQAAKHLTTLRPMFLLDATRADSPKVPELFQQTLRADVLIAVTDQQIRERPNTVPMGRILPVGGGEFQFNMGLTR